MPRAGAGEVSRACAKQARELRQSIGMSQGDLGAASEVGDRRTVERLEAGRASMTVDQLAAIAAALGVEAWLLLRDAMEPPPPRRRRAT